MPIRVLQVVTYMQRGGLETMLMNYYRNIDRSKVQFDFLVHRDFEADYDREILELGGRIYRLPVLNPIGAEYLGKLDQFYKDHPEYRIVHSHLDCLAGIPLKYAKKNKVPVRIAHAHNNNQTMNWKYPIKLFFRRNITKYANYLLACSREAGNWMFRTNRFEVLNNAIDAKQYIYDKNVRDKVKKELHIEQNKLVFGHIGRFLTQKNHKFLIEVFKKIVEMHPDSILLLIGDGELQQNIKEKVRQEGLESRVIFAGIRGDVPQLLQAMDVFIFPSLFEGLGIVIIEAQAAGLPCLISERVPDECEKTKGLVQKLSLDSGAERWAETALQCVKIKRRNTLKEIQTAGFDIVRTATKLQQFYLKL